MYGLYQPDEGLHDSHDYFLYCMHTANPIQNGHPVLLPESCDRHCRVCLLSLLTALKHTGTREGKNREGPQRFAYKQLETAASNIIPTNRVRAVHGVIIIAPWKPTTVGIPQAHRPKTNVLRAYCVNTCRKAG